MFVVRMTVSPRCVYVCVLQLQSPIQIMMGIDMDQRSELEAMINDLEEENRYVT